jgi:hypothetical protein
MKVSIGEMIDGLSVVNIKTFYLVDKVQNGSHEVKDQVKIQALNKRRWEFINGINEYFDERQEIKL